MVAPIATAPPIPRPSPSEPADAGSARAATRERRRPRDHALGLHRFLGVVQIFGGLTLVAAYSLGAPSVGLDRAPSLLVGLGLVQMAAGFVMLTRTRALRTLIIRQPGFFALSTLGAAILVMSLGGSNSDALFVTSAMCWLIASGYPLPGARWVAASVVATVIPTAVWIAVDGSRGGFDADGGYLPAVIGLIAAVVPGLWLGRTTGEASITLNRWYLVEIHEQGLVNRLRAVLGAVGDRVARVGQLLPAGAAADEIAALRSRLTLGAGLSSDEAESTTLGPALEELRAEHAAAGATTRLDVVTPAGVAALGLTAATADALVAVIRRQLTNVVRHAPDATVITLAATHEAGRLRVRIEDDGGGRVPFRAGTGTAWSQRQLARVAGKADYYAGDTGVGFEISVPVAARSSVSNVPGLSISEGLERFGRRMLGAMRWAGWVVDSLAAQGSADTIGAWWLIMPAGAIVAELVIQRGLPGVATARDVRALVASLVLVVVTAAFTIPADSPEVLVTATSSAVVLSHLLWERRERWWLAVEFLRALAVLPLLLRYGLPTIELLVIYPAGFALIILAMTRFVTRARGLEATAADAAGRATLASAAVQGLSLRHDAVDVILRSGSTDGEMRQSVDDLEASLGELRSLTDVSLDPREVMLTGVQAALARPVRVDFDQLPEGAPDAPTVAGAIDRITLIEIAALAADERASCAPPGLFGRRRLAMLAMRWSTAADGRSLECRLMAEPSLQPPDGRSLDRLRSVAETLGIAVDSTPEALTITMRRR